MALQDASQRIVSRLACDANLVWQARDSWIPYNSSPEDSMVRAALCHGMRPIYDAISVRLVAR